MVLWDVEQVFIWFLAGDYTSKDILPLVKEMYLFMKDFEGDVPGACAKDCGNYLDMNLNMAKHVCNRYYNEVLCNITNERLAYPNNYCKILSNYYMSLLC